MKEFLKKIIPFPQHEKRTGKWDTLEGVLDEIWTMLKRGATRYNDPFHWPVLGTTGKGGCNLRTVILRKVILPDRILVCHSDARAGKVLEIANSPKVCWLFYHPKRKVQLRITGRAELHTDGSFADRQWADTGMTSRLNYCGTEAPGVPVVKPTSGLPDFLRHKIPTFLESERGRKHFAAIICRVDSIDWLILRVMGNRRARFVWDQNGLSAAWLVP